MQRSTLSKHSFEVRVLLCRVTTEHATITRITGEVLEDMGADNVIFAELRTTPKVSCAPRPK